MNAPQLCPECGSEIPAGSPAGMCPKCLLKAGFESQPPEDARFQATAPSPQAKTGFIPPTITELGALFPQLDILELLGQGGMGAVYKARQKGLDRLVAVKILPPEIGQDPAFAERFMREARALAILNHPNIVAVYDFGQVQGQFYFLMEYVDGVNLRQAIRAGKISPQECLAIVPQICDALQFAHDEGVVHRDIKPENILLDKKGRVKIADFGLAKLLGAEVTDHTLTATHQVMGTMRYMAPEQMLGTKSVDHRADIYSLGVVFYELLTGEIPLGRFAPPSKKVQIDVRLDEVVLRALEREPEQRYQQASEVRDDLRKVASETNERMRDRSNQSSASPPISDSVSDSLEGPAAALFFAGLLMVVLSLLIVLWNVANLASIALAPPSSSQSGMTVTVTHSINAYHWIALITQFLVAGAGTVVMLASFAMRRFESRNFALAGCYIALLPITPAWIFTLPAGLWALLTLQRPRIMRHFEYAELHGQPEHSPENAPSWQEHLGKVGVITAAMALLGTIATFLPWVSVSILGVRIVYFGHQTPLGICSGIAFLAVFLWTITTGYFRLPRLYLQLSQLIVGILVIGVTGSIFVRAVSPPHVTQGPINVVGDATQQTAEAMVKPMLDGVLSSISNGTLFGVWIAFAAGCALLVCGCVRQTKSSTENLESSGEPRLSRLAIAGALWTPILWGLTIFATLALVVYAETHRHEGNLHSNIDVISSLAGGAVILLSAIGTTLLGGIALIQIRRSKGRLYGARLALIELLFYPCLFLNSALISVTLFLRLDVNSPRIYILPLCCLAAFVVQFYLIRKLWRWGTGWKPPEQTSEPVKPLVAQATTPEQMLPPLLAVAIGLILGLFCLTIGLLLIPAAFMFAEVGSGPFWGWLGGAFGCMIGGFGSLAGSWNSYRQLRGESDWLQSTKWTTFDSCLLVYGVVGLLLLTVGPLLSAMGAWGTLSDPRILNTYHGTWLLGGLMVFQAALFLLFRAGSLSSGAQQRWIENGKGTPFPIHSPTLKFVLWMLTLAAILVFVSFNMNTQQGEKQAQASTISVGAIDPWFIHQSNFPKPSAPNDATGKGGFTTSINALSWSFFAFALALVTGMSAWRMEREDAGKVPVDARWWQTHAKQNGYFVVFYFLVVLLNSGWKSHVKLRDHQKASNTSTLIGQNARGDAATFSSAQSADRHITYLGGHTSIVRAVAVSTDGKTLASTGLDGRVIIRNLPTGTVRHVIRTNDGNPSQPAKPLHCVTISPNDFYAFASGNHEIELQKIRLDKNLVETFPISSNGSITWLTAYDGQQSLAFVRGNTTFVCFDLANKKELTSTPIFPGKAFGNVRTAAVDPDRHYFAVTSSDMLPNKDGAFTSTEPCKLTIFDIQTGKEVLSWPFKDYTDFSFAQVVFVDTRSLAVCLPSGQMLRWTLDADNKWIANPEPIQISPGRFTASAASRDGNLIWLAQDRQIIGIHPTTGKTKYWSDLEIGERRDTFSAFPIEALASTTEPQTVAAALWDGRVALVQCQKRE